MVDGKSLHSSWQSLLDSYRAVFTRLGWRRFERWVTGMVQCQEEYMLTRTLIASGLEDQWRAQERFASSGRWDRFAAEQETVRLMEQESAVCWNGYRSVALDDTKSHRTSKDEQEGVGRLHVSGKLGTLSESCHNGSGAQLGGAVRPDPGSAVVVFAPEPPEICKLLLKWLDSGKILYRVAKRG